MAGNEYHPTRPKAHLVPDDVDLRHRILAGSPLAVQGILLEALREYFMDPEAPYQWSSDVNSAGVVVEAGSNPQVEARNVTRGVYVTRLGSTPVQVALGDRMGVALPTGQESFYAHMQTNFQIDCTSANKGDVELLGDYVHHFLIASRRILEASYGLHEMSMATLGAVSGYASDSSVYTVPLNFQITHPFRWTTVRIAPVLRQMSLRMLVRTGPSGLPDSAQALAEAPDDAAFIESAFNSINPENPEIPSDLNAPPRT